MKFVLFPLSILLTALSGRLPAQPERNADPVLRQAFSIGETVAIRSRRLAEDRTLNIYLPAGYGQDSLKAYPVIYLLDGSADEDFIHIAGIVQFGTFPWVNMLPESIVVGIANVDRERDFTFPAAAEADKKDFPTSGGSGNFIRFLETELKPFVASNYRTNDTLTLIGQSLGGLLAAEILFKRPELFTHYIIVSPSLWWDGESLLKLEPKPCPSEGSVFVAVGKEGEVMERTAKTLADKIKQGNPEQGRTYFDFLENQDHANILHLAVYRAFERIFSKK